MKAKSESHSKKRKAFHAKYLAICKASIIQPLPEVKSKKKNLHVLDFHGDRIRYNDWLAVCGALKNDESLKFVAIRMRKNDEMGKFEYFLAFHEVNKFLQFRKASTT